VPPPFPVAVPDKASVAATERPRQRIGRILGSLALLLAAGFVVWLFVPSSEPVTNRPGDTPGERLALPREPLDKTSPRQGPYDVEGIEGIVDIDDAGPGQTPGPGAREQQQVVIQQLALRARAGDADAMSSLALGLQVGVGTSADPLAAIEWLQRAAKAGNAEAMQALAVEYESGIWVEADARRARSLREQAARAGSLLARWELEP